MIISVEDYPANCDVPYGISLQVPWSGVFTKYSTSPFPEEMFEKMARMLSEYEVVINRWPQYTPVLENVSSMFCQCSLVLENLSSIFDKLCVYMRRCLCC